jgi:translation initiation factor 2 alpha subunit (eIF-2alpha)
LTKQKSRTIKSSPANNSSDDSRKQIPLLTKELKFDKQIDIPNPKLQHDETETYSLFANSSKNENNTHYPELEKLSNKLNKTFKKKGVKCLLKKQKELNDTTIQISIVSANGGVFLTYTKPDTQKNRRTSN